MNKIRFLSSFLKKLLGKGVVFSVWHSVTFRCNLRCRYCGLWKQKRDELPTGEIKFLMDKYAKLGVVVWNFTGGEPLLRGDIGELIQYAKSKGFYVTLVTNGFFVPERIESLRKSDVVLVSLDGTREVTDRLRGKGAYSKAILAIKALKKSNVPFRIDTVVSSENMNERDIGHLVELAKKYNTDINLIPMYLDQYNQGTKLSKDLDGLYEIISRNQKYFNTTKRYVKYLRGEVKLDCLAGKNFVHIFPDGKVAPCFFLENSKKPKNCFCESLCYNTYNLLLKPDIRFIFEILKKRVQNIFKFRAD